MKSEEINKKKNDSIWKIALIIFCFGIITRGYFFSINTFDNILFLILSEFPIAMIIWGIFYLLFARKHGIRVGLISFFIIYTCIIMGYYIGNNEQKYERIKTLKYLRNGMSTSTGSITYPEDLYESSEQLTDTNSNINDDLLEVEKFIDNYIKDLIALKDEYHQKLKTIGLNKILDANRLKEDEFLIESEVIIKNAKLVVSEYQNKSYNFLFDTREKIKSLNISETSKNAMLLGFDLSYIQYKDKMEELWELEKKAIDVVEELINFLRSENNGWIVIGNQILFYNSQDSKKYNSFIMSIKSIEKQQNQIQKEFFENINQMFDILQN